MNNKKIISGAVWTVGLLAVGVGGFWYFSGGAGPGGSVAWSNGVALVESSWDEAVGLPAGTSTVAAALIGNSESDDDQGSNEQAAQATVTPPSPPTPPGPPPVYSIADVGSFG